MWSGVEVTHLMVCTFFECITVTVNLVMSSWINDSLQNWQKYIFTSNNLCPFWTFDWTIFLSVGNQPSLHQAFFTSGVFYNFHSEERVSQSNCPIEMMAKTPGSCTGFGRFLGSTEPLEDFAENN